MTKKIFLCFAVVGATLLGCTTTMKLDGVTGAPCNTAICQVDVYVSGTPPVVTVNQQILTVAKGNHGAGGNGVLILWVLKDSPGYALREDSIQFYDPKFSRQFDQPDSGGNGAQFHWRDQNDDGLKWGYQIKVYDRSTGVWTPLDPWIQNG